MKTPSMNICENLWLKSFLLALCLCASVVKSQTPVLFSMQSLTGATANWPILVQPDNNWQTPLWYGTNLVPTAPFTIQPIGGQVVTNLMPWGYTITVQGWPRSVHIVVPAGTNTLNAVSLINTNQFSPLQLFGPFLGLPAVGSNGAAAVMMLGLDSAGHVSSNAVPTGGGGSSQYSNGTNLITGSTLQYSGGYPLTDIYGDLFASNTIYAPMIQSPWIGGNYGLWLSDSSGGSVINFGGNQSMGGSDSEFAWYCTALVSGPPSATLSEQNFAVQGNISVGTSNGPGYAFFGNGRGLTNVPTATNAQYSVTASNLVYSTSGTSWSTQPSAMTNAFQITGATYAPYVNNLILTYSQSLSTGAEFVWTNTATNGLEIYVTWNDPSWGPSWIVATNLPDSLHAALFMISPSISNYGVTTNSPVGCHLWDNPGVLGMLTSGTVLGLLPSLYTGGVGAYNVVATNVVAGSGTFGAIAGNAGGLTNLQTTSLVGTINGTILVGSITNLIGGNAAGLTNATPLAALGPNSLPGSNTVAQMISSLAPSPAFPAPVTIYQNGTNCIINLQAYTNTYPLTLRLFSTNNVNLLWVTNAADGKQFIVDIWQGQSPTNSITFGTTKQPGTAMFITNGWQYGFPLPTNSPASHLKIGVSIDNGTNATIIGVVAVPM